MQPNVRRHVYAALLPVSGLLIALLVFFDVLVPGLPVEAQVPEQCFEETGFCVTGAFIAAWENAGGMGTLGYPITELRTEVNDEGLTVPVQWFLRGRLEDRGANGIVVAAVGTERLIQQGYNIWDEAFRAQETIEGCEYINETGQNVCEPFLSFWRNNGGIGRFGLPLTGPRTEQIGDWQGTVQYFERYRMEHRPELAAEGNEVLLGHLGQEWLVAQAPRVCGAGVAPDMRDAADRVPFRRVLGCPLETLSTEVVVQPFERGGMLWVDSGAYGRRILSYSSHSRMFQRVYEDTWQEGEPDAPDMNAVVPEYRAPPADRVVPLRGFGKVWAADGEITYRLGWGTSPEQRSPATVQVYDQGMLIWVHANNMVYAFGPRGDDVAVYERPALSAAAPNQQALLVGQPAPRIGGELVVRTQSVDFYRLPGALTAAEIRDLSSEVEEIVAANATLVGTTLRGRVSLRFEPGYGGSCPLLGVAYTGNRFIEMYYSPGSNRDDVRAILAHELLHQLQHDYYGPGDHLSSDTILLEGMAVWGSHRYERTADGEPAYLERVRRAYQNGQRLSVTRNAPGNCRTPNRAGLYDQWGAFTEFLIERYGRARYDQVYASRNGRSYGSSNWRGVYGKSLGELEAEWVQWIAAKN